MSYELLTGKPQDVDLHTVDTSKGRRGIFVQSVVGAQKSESLFVTLVLEQNMDEEPIRSRRLVMLLSASELASPADLNGVLNQIRDWLETTEGDGSLGGLPQSK